MTMRTLVFRLASILVYSGAWAQNGTSYSWRLSSRSTSLTPPELKGLTISSSQPVPPKNISSTISSRENGASPLIVTTSQASVAGGHYNTSVEWKTWITSTAPSVSANYSDGKVSCADGAAFNRIYSAASGHSYGICMNTDFFGGDEVPINGISSAEACAMACDGSQTCVGASLHVNIGICFLKRFLPSPNPKVGVDSVVKLSEYNFLSSDGTSSLAHTHNPTKIPTTSWNSWIMTVSNRTSLTSIHSVNSSISTTTTTSTTNSPSSSATNSSSRNSQQGWTNTTSTLIVSVISTISQTRMTTLTELETTTVTKSENITATITRSLNVTVLETATATRLENITSTVLQSIETTLTRTATITQAENITSTIVQTINTTFAEIVTSIVFVTSAATMPSSSSPSTFDSQEINNGANTLTASDSTPPVNTGSSPAVFRGSQAPPIATTSSSSLSSPSSSPSSSASTSTNNSSDGGPLPSSSGDLSTDRPSSSTISSAPSIVISANTASALPVVSTATSPSLDSVIQTSNTDSSNPVNDSPIVTGTVDSNTNDPANSAASSFITSPLPSSTISTSAGSIIVDAVCTADVSEGYHDGTDCEKCPVIIENTFEFAPPAICYEEVVVATNITYYNTLGQDVGYSISLHSTSTQSQARNVIVLNNIDRPSTPAIAVKVTGFRGETPCYVLTNTFTATALANPSHLTSFCATPTKKLRLTTLSPEWTSWAGARPWKYDAPMAKRQLLVCTATASVIGSEAENADGYVQWGMSQAIQETSTISLCSTLQVDASTSGTQTLVNQITVRTRVAEPVVVSSAGSVSGSDIQAGSNASIPNARDNATAVNANGIGQTSTSRTGEISLTAPPNLQSGNSIPTMAAVNMTLVNGASVTITTVDSTFLTPASTSSRAVSNQISEQASIAGDDGSMTKSLTSFPSTVDAATTTSTDAARSRRTQHPSLLWMILAVLL